MTLCCPTRTFERARCKSLLALSQFSGGFLVPNARADEQARRGPASITNVTQPKRTLRSCTSMSGKREIAQKVSPPTNGFPASADAASSAPPAQFSGERRRSDRKFRSNGARHYDRSPSRRNRGPALRRGPPSGRLAPTGPATTRAARSCVRSTSGPSHTSTRPSNGNYKFQLYAPCGRECGFGFVHTVY